nr:glutathione S-transferase family protein [Novosphingobium percolationis]
MFLWSTPLSPFVEKVKIALREKGLPFDAAVPDGIGVGVSNALIAANPRSEAPALVEGDVVLFDSTVILEYLEDRFPEVPLRPASAAARARVRMIEDVCDTHYEAVNWGLFELNYFKRGQGEGLAQTLFAAARADLAVLHDWLELQLGADPWFGGPAFGLGDVVVAPFIEGSRFNGVALDPSRPLGRWFARVSARPTVAETFAESQAGSELLHTVADALDAGLLRRHYRDHRLEWMMRAGGAVVVANGLAADTIRFTDLAPLASLSPFRK